MKVIGVFSLAEIFSVGRPKFLKITHKKPPQFKPLRGVHLLWGVEAKTVVSVVNIKTTSIYFTSNGWFNEKKYR